MSGAPHLFVAALGAEVNTFAPLPINEDRFAEVALFRRGALPRAAPPPLIAAPLQHAWALEAQGCARVTQGLCAGAQPGGIVSRQTYEALRNAILADLAAALPVDAVLLGLHGATVANGYEDCEGDLLAHVRALVGPDAPVLGLLDPHCHLTESMLAHADVLMAYKEYPHTDIFETAEKLVEAALAMATGRLRPAMAAIDCRMLAILHTTREPVLGLIAELRALCKTPGVLDISIAHGFPWGDVADEGVRVWAVTEGDPALAHRLASRLAERVRSLRGDTRSPILDHAGALAALRAAPPGLIVIADSADNPGGGAPGDATYLIRSLLDAGQDDFAAGLFWDPVAVDLCCAAGEGARLPLRLGGKAARMSGPPLDLTVTVERIRTQVRQAFAGSLWPAGTVAHVRSGASSFLISSNRVQCFDAETFALMGVDLGAKRLAVVKSSQHFHASFAPLAAQTLYVEGPGALGDIAALPFTRLERPIWPLDDLPPMRTIWPKQHPASETHSP